MYIIQLWMQKLTQKDIDHIKRVVRSAPGWTKEEQEFLFKLLDEHVLLH